MAYQTPEPAPGGYSENGVTWFLDVDRDEWAFGERLDAATNLPTVEAPVAPPTEPAAGWGEGTLIVDGRPVRRVAPVASVGNVCMMLLPTAPRARGPRRRGTTRAARSRSSRRSPSASRDGPSDEDGGDGEGPPPPLPPDVAIGPDGGPCTNSHPADIQRPRWRVAGYGIDTIAFGWHDADASDALRRIAYSGLVDDATGGRQRADYDGSHMRLSIPVMGITIGVYRAKALVTAEARAAAMLAGHSCDHNLVPPERIPEAAARARAALTSIGVHVGGPVIVRRLDLAGDLWFADADGTAYLYACRRGLHLTRLALHAWDAKGHPRLESIAWQTPSRKTIQLRMYDAGSKHGSAGAGQLVRVERQRRWQHPKTPTPEQIVASDLGVTFSEPVRAWLRAPHDVTIMMPPTAIAYCFEKARRGQLTPREAETLGAKINSLAYGDDLLTPLKRRRRQRDLRDAGLAIDMTGDPGARPVDLVGPLAALTECWTRRSRP